ncbi:MarR family winged helix-turn-helix transcriptional regulator [Cobetia marina]|uniref:MarR family winged helix-turn-helix transcriptional regulator n=2 Tax=Cobetia TaxID=204286 RepID=UPI00384FF1BD
MATTALHEVLHRLMHVYRKQLRDGIQQHGIDLPVLHIRMLKSIVRVSECTAHKVGQLLGQDKGRVTRVLNELEARGLVSRHQNPQDRRSQLLQVSAAGSDMLERVKVLEQETAQRMAGDLGDEEIAAFLNTATRMMDNVSACGDFSADVPNGNDDRSA